MTVKEFFEKFAPIIQLHSFNKTTNINDINVLRIKLYDGGGMGGGYFTAIGEVSLRGGSVYYTSTFEKPFEDVYFGKKIDGQIKAVSARDLDVKRWNLEETKTSMNKTLLLTIEIDNKVK